MRFYGIIVFLILFLSCNKDVSPIGESTDLSLVESDWPDSIYADGYGSVNDSLPPQARRAASLESAKLDFLEIITDSVYNLPLNKNQIINEFVTDDGHLSLKIQIEHEINNFSIVSAIFLPDSSAVLYGYITLDQIKIIVKQYFK